MYHNHSGATNHMGTIAYGAKGALEVALKEFRKIFQPEGEPK